MSSWLQVVAGLVLVVIGGGVASAIPSNPLIGVIITVIGVLVATGPSFIGKKKE